MTGTLEGVCHIDVLCSLVVVRQSPCNTVADIPLIKINVNYGPKIMMNSANAIMIIYIICYTYKVKNVT